MTENPTTATVESAPSKSKEKKKAKKRARVRRSVKKGASPNAGKAGPFSFLSIQSLKLFGSHKRS